MTFTIEVRPHDVVRRGTSPEERGAGEVRAVAIRAGDVVFTRLLRPGAAEPDDYLRVPPAPLAWWLVDHWWRLRYECVPSGGRFAEWRRAHDLTAIGGGYVWPRLEMWGEGARVGLLSRRDPAGAAGPVQYLTGELQFVPADAFERGVDEFLSYAADPGAAVVPDWEALRDYVAALRGERADPEYARWRRLEAELGFDPDAGPEGLLAELLTLGERFGDGAVGEAAQAAQGADAGAVLRHEIDAARTGGVACDLAPAVGVAAPAGDAAGRPQRPGDAAGPPWVAAERAAGAVRAAFDVAGPVRNPTFAEIVGSPRTAFYSQRWSRSRAEPGSGTGYGLRLRDAADGRGAGGDRVGLRAITNHDRRFELARALGDAIWAQDDALGPITRTKTARQKFQRAFAQALLCPLPALREFLGTDDPADEAISAAAQHFQVATRVVETVLVNKRVVARDRFPDVAHDGTRDWTPEGTRLDQLVEAA